MEPVTACDCIIMVPSTLLLIETIERMTLALSFLQKRPRHPARIMVWWGFFARRILLINTVYQQAVIIGVIRKQNS